MSDKPRVLVVDDNPVNLKVAKVLLEKKGVQIDSVMDGETAFSAIQKAPYQMVLMDVQLPGMDEAAALMENIRHHTEKGAAMTMGVDEMADLCHSMEDLIREIQEGRTGAKPEVFDVLFQANDTNNTILESLTTSSTVSVDITTILSRIQGMISSGECIPVPSVSGSGLEKSEKAPTSNRKNLEEEEFGDGFTSQAILTTARAHLKMIEANSTT